MNVTDPAIYTAVAFLAYDAAGIAGVGWALVSFGIVLAMLQALFDDD